MTVVRLRSRSGHQGWVGPFAREDSFVVMLHLREVVSQSLCLDGEVLHLEGCPAGAVNVLDLRREVSISTPTPFDCIYFHVSLESLNLGQREPVVLAWQQGRREPTTWRLGTQLLRALHAPRSFGAGQLESVAGRLNAHFAQSYGTPGAPSKSYRGGLAPWQVRRALKVMKGSLQAPLGFEEVAAACSLSVSHFHRAFRQSIGESPGRWLQQYRMEVAKELLLSSPKTLAEISARCGFADQSHFTRVFTRWAGMSPGAWRREQQEALVRQLDGGLKKTGAKETAAEVSSSVPGVGALSLRIQPGAPPPVTSSG
jgi:AraC-like DNA-binding protein